MRSAFLRWGLVTGVGAALAAASASAAARTATFNVTAVHSGIGVQVTMNSKVWVTPTQARADVTDPVNGNVTYLVSNGSFYHLDPKTKQGMKGPLPPQLKNSKDNFSLLVSQFAFDAGRVMEQAKKIRTESVAGYTCDVYTASMSKGEATRSITVWMPQKMDPKFPLKAVKRDRINKQGATVDQTVTITLSNVRVGAAIPASVFAVPKGYKIVAGKPQAPKPGK